VLEKLVGHDRFVPLPRCERDVARPAFDVIPLSKDPSAQAAAFRPTHPGERRMTDPSTIEPTSSVSH
jgi:hypothetical protein